MEDRCGGAAEPARGRTVAALAECCVSWGRRAGPAANQPGSGSVAEQPAWHNGTALCCPRRSTNSGWSGRMLCLLGPAAHQPGSGSCPTSSRGRSYRKRVISCINAGVPRSQENVTPLGRP
eukprot:CAMPEP_0180224708 /NCGR_PEP_ID=MMETSP0987-20121128/22249_1 /TAXON_ID=697907 /ORGANISM="non described non described, Strain CCMP2293" /LENGTH=120 /DNA_ID=CAMNT_0022187603 /DNA_START=370 /DNA_END=728 /DNA_ORIENTATION=+